jgi:ribosome-associated protein
MDDRQADIQADIQANTQTDIQANTQTITLSQYLKLMDVVQTGGEAKLVIQNGNVSVNGVVETRRGRKLVVGDRVEVFGEVLTVEDDGED